MSETKIVILGRPIPYVRMTKRGKFVKENAQRYLTYKDKVGWIARSYIKTMSNKKIDIKVIVYLNGKKSEFGRDGDVDNYLKTAMDALNKIAYKDDRQVVKASVEKLSCNQENERMEIKIREVS